jgi:hypothetical protein
MREVSTLSPMRLTQVRAGAARRMLVELRS